MMEPSKNSAPSPQPLAAPPAIGSLRTVSPRGSNASLSSDASTTSTQPMKSSSHGLGRKNSSCGSLSLSTAKSKAPEKTGRWTEEEHEVFLQGLEKHGKQWKLIASMIGTRTVVQVRTHAQKYFQKLERKNNPVPAAAASVVPVPAPAMTTASKRKSLPASLPSRKKQALKSVSSPKKPRISISLSSLAPSPLPDRVSPPLVLYPSLSAENLSTISPSGVADVDLSSSSYTDAHYSEGAGVKSIVSVGANSYVAGNAATNQGFDHYEDPLDWFDSDESMEQLPESSLPAFPDFNNLIAPSLDNNNAGLGGPIFLQPQCSSMNYHHQHHPDAFAPSVTCDQGGDEEDDDDLMPSFVIEDPKITAQTLLEDGNDVF